MAVSSELRLTAAPVLAAAFAKEVERAGLLGVMKSKDMLLGEGEGEGGTLLLGRGGVGTAERKADEVAV